jgi:hypothetical protein
VNQAKAIWGSCRRTTTDADPCVSPEYRQVIDGDPDRVRQHWEISRDGSTWETLFDGRYARRRD